jgi:hypothetical protein
MAMLGIPVKTMLGIPVKTMLGIPVMAIMGIRIFAVCTSNMFEVLGIYLYLLGRWLGFQGLKNSLWRYGHNLK